jgi:dTDP-4-amino-4,6-dideoxygalactose transaminase
MAAILEKSVKNKNFNLAECVGMDLMKRHPNIEIRPAFYPLHKMTSFIKDAMPCPNADNVYQTLLCVPSSAQLTEMDVKEVSGALRESLEDVLAGF